MMQHFARILFFLLVVKPLLLVILGVNVFQKDNLPKSRQFIMVANHNSHLDALALMNLFPLGRLHHIHPVAAADYFEVNPVMAWFSKTFLNIIPIPRTQLTKSNNPLKRMGEALENGHSLIIFPEGSRGQPEKMASFQTGVAHLAQKFPQVPVIPVFMRGMGRSLPKGEFILVPFFCDLIIGRPLFCSGKKEEILGSLELAMQQLQETLHASV
jgi:1-acyl-sn-glycerol-3-phosphate acyltransferase